MLSFNFLTRLGPTLYIINYYTYSHIGHHYSVIYLKSPKHLYVGTSFIPLYYADQCWEKTCNQLRWSSL